MSRIRHALSLVSAAAALALLAAGGCDQPPPDEHDRPPAGPWALTWSDEFDRPAGTPPDPAWWTYDVGGHGWGNQQLEFNTDRIENAQHDGQGSLVITARREDYGPNAYTSARIRTQGRFEQAYGRFEARMKLPRGQGLWPAFWLLGGHYAEVGWPECGEIDVMEYRGNEPGVVHGSAHGPGYSGGNPLTARYELPDGPSFADEFHVFAVEWEPGRIRWLVDDEPYHTITEATLSGNRRWVFDQPAFVILNLAVGGWFPGDPDDAVFPQSLHVDYVRVYEQVEQE